MKKNTVLYTEGPDTFEGYYAYQGDAKKPVVMVCHDWAGKSFFTEERAEAFAKEGYLGFAVDVYGKGIHPETNDEKAAVMGAVLEDRSRLLRRLLTAYEVAKKLPSADPDKIIVMGYCFGGLCALDLARHGLDFKAAIALHAALTPPTGTPKPLGPVKAKVLVFHGYRDPRVPPEEIVKFGDEMTKADAEWDMTIYGKAQHGFAKPHANSPEIGVVHHPESNRKSWKAMLDFMSEEFK